MRTPRRPRSVVSRPVPAARVLAGGPACVLGACAGALAPAAVLVALGGLAAAQQVPPTLLVDRFAPSALASDVASSRDVALGDVDGDGDLDAVVALDDGSDNALYLNDGAGAFTHDPTAFAGSGGVTRGVTLADVDGDGDLDVFFANNPATPNALFLNQGGRQHGTAGVFGAVRDGPVVTDNANSRRGTFADVDSDGDLDLFVANGSDDDNFLYCNLGGAQSGEPGTFARLEGGDATSDGGISHEGTFADLDDDGDLDLLVANHGGVPGGGPGRPNSLYRNDGTGVFTRVTAGAAATDEHNSQCARFVDFDGDADPDLFVGNNQGDPNRLYENVGGGVLVPFDGGIVTSERGETSQAVWLDAEGDGDLDLFIANRETEYGRGVLDRRFNRLFLNLGGGAFARQDLGPLFTDADDSYGAAAGDLDGDGWIDLVVANRGEPNALYRNGGPQWADLGAAFDGGAGGAGAPSLGGRGHLLPHQPVELSLDGAPPNASAWLVMGTRTVMAELKGGTLVPAPDAVVALGTMDGSGALAPSALAPAGLDPGLELFFQGWVVDAGAAGGFVASNALRATVP